MIMITTYLTVRFLIVLTLFFIPTKARVLRQSTKCQFFEEGEDDGFGCDLQIPENIERAIRINFEVQLVMPNPTNCVRTHAHVPLFNPSTGNNGMKKLRLFHYDDTEGNVGVSSYKNHLNLVEASAFMRGLFQHRNGDMYFPINFYIDDLFPDNYFSYHNARVTIGILVESTEEEYPHMSSTRMAMNANHTNAT